jgi:hypothetical protein
MLAAMKKSMENYWMRVSTSGELFVFLLVTYLIPSIHQATARSGRWL